MFPIYSVLICPNLKFSIPSLVLRSVHGLYDDFLLLFLLKRDIYDFRYFVLVWIYAFLANLFYFILFYFIFIYFIQNLSSKYGYHVFHFYYAFLLYIYFFFSWFILKRGIHDMDCFICVSMHELHLDLFIYLLLFPIILIWLFCLYFFHTLLYPRYSCFGMYRLWVLGSCCF